MTSPLTDIAFVLFAVIGVYALFCVMTARLPKQRSLRWFVILFVAAMVVNGVVKTVAGRPLFVLFPISEAAR